MHRFAKFFQLFKLESQVNFATRGRVAAYILVSVFPWVILASPSLLSKTKDSSGK